MECTAFLVCFISTVNGRSKKKKEKKPIMSGASSGHITKLKQSILLRCLCSKLTHWYRPNQAVSYHGAQKLLEDDSTLLGR